MHVECTVFLKWTGLICQLFQHAPCLLTHHALVVMNTKERLAKSVTMAGHDRAQHCRASNAMKKSHEHVELYGDEFSSSSWASARVSKLVFYARSTGAVISGRSSARNYRCF